MNESNFPIHRKLLFVNAETGERLPFIAGISFPFQQENGDFSCHVCLTCKFETPMTIQGVDPLQAVSLSIGMLEKLLKPLLDRGEIFWPDGNPYEAV